MRSGYGAREAIILRLKLARSRLDILGAVRGIYSGFLCLVQLKAGNRQSPLGIMMADVEGRREFVSR